jgi:hypothetical protein
MNTRPSIYGEKTRLLLTIAVNPRALPALGRHLTLANRGIIEYLDGTLRAAMAKVRG